MHVSVIRLFILLVTSHHASNLGQRHPPKMIPNMPKLKQQSSHKDIVTYQNQRRVETLPSNIKSYFSQSKSHVFTKRKVGNTSPHQGGAKGRVVLETLFFQSSS